DTRESVPSPSRDHSGHCRALPPLLGCPEPLPTCPSTEQPATSLDSCGKRCFRPTSVASVRDGAARPSLSQKRPWTYRLLRSFVSVLRFPPFHPYARALCESP